MHDDPRRRCQQWCSSFADADDLKAMIGSVRSALGATSAAFFVLDQGSTEPRAEVYDNHPEDLALQYRQHYHKLDVWQAAARASGWPKRRVEQGQELVPLRDLQRTEFHADVLRPWGIEGLLAARIGRHGNGHTFAVCHFATAEAEDANRPTLERMAGLLGDALRLHERVAELTMRSALQEASAEPRPAFAVDASGLIVHANPPGTAALREGGVLREGNGRLVAATPRDDVWLCVAVGRAADDPAAVSERRTVRVADQDDGMALIEVAPLPKLVETSVPLSGCVVVTVTTPKAAPQRAVETASAMFGWTPGEARVVGALVEGVDLRTAASACGVTYETARTYLKRTLAKADCQRQAELVALVERLR